MKNVPLNLFWDHVFTKYGGKYFDPSYGLVSNTSFVDDDTLLNDYSNKALSGVLYAKLDIGNPLIDAIKYKPQTNKYLDPFNTYLLTPVAKNNYKYKTVITKMEKELIKQVIPN